MKQMEMSKQSHFSSSESQKRVDAFSEKSQQMLSDYLANQRQAEVTEAYNRQLTKLVGSQADEIASLQSQIDSIEQTEQAMLPMLNDMVMNLENFIAQDVPFLSRERTQRINKLRLLLDRANVSVAEKYRQILQAYMVEVGYGRTIEAYSGALELAEQSTRQVNFLRMGRVALYYQSLNGMESALWLHQQKKWQRLDAKQNLEIGKAIQIAQQQRVPEILELSLPLSVTKKPDPLISSAIAKANL